MAVLNRPAFCPACGSVDIRIVARLPGELVCLCQKCSTEFSVKGGADTPAPD